MSTSFISSEAVESVRDSFNFGVAKRPLTMQLGTETIETPCFGLFRDDNWKFIGEPGNTVSEKYVPHTTDDVISLVDAAASVFDGSEVSCKCHWRDGHYVVIKPDDQYRRAVAKNDTVYPRMVIRAGYDGQSYQFSFGTFREACTNLMMTRKVSGMTVKIAHRANLREQMNELITDMSQFDGKWDELVAHWENLQSIRNVDMSEFFVNLFGVPDPKASESTKTRYINMIKKIKVRLIEERFRLTGEKGDQNKANGWELYNAIQGYHQHDMTRKNGATPFDRMIMANKSTDKAFALNNKAETMLLQMA